MFREAVLFNPRYWGFWDTQKLLHIALLSTLDKTILNRRVLRQKIKTSKAMQIILFKTGERSIYWQKQLKEFKEDQILRTLSDFDYFRSQVFLVLSCQNLVRKFQQHFCILLWLSYQIWTRCNTCLSRLIYIKVSCHVWNVAEVYATSFCFVVKRRSTTVLTSVLYIHQSQVSFYQYTVLIIQKQLLPRFFNQLSMYNLIFNFHSIHGGIV